ncbi:MAG: D-alanyl-D-alanine carboxypeptidase family protein [Brachymonas sp.]|uniref:D-alanyl-D-alanine carboxypeptidase family protein n=1 Tax=Brachymonas sp. M4Q-1 TaxID=3416906 RepID=UPI003CE70A61
MPVLSSLRSRFVLVTATLALTFGGLALAKKAPPPAPVAAPAAVAPVLPGFPVPPDVAARAYLLLDVSAGNQVLAAKDMDTPMEPASLTKLMTAYVVFDALKQHRITLDQTFGVSEKAWKMPGSRMFITPKMQVRVEDLIRGMIVQSGNDATMALAEGLAGSEQGFVQKMNDTARTLGMTHTGYRNPEGLTEPGHITTARDMALLATRLMADFPEYIKYYAIKQWHYPGTPESNQNNRNLLLFRDPTVDGLKTGHTDAAGYNLVATARRAFPNLPQGRRLLAVVFGTASENARANETQKLLNWGYTAYDGVQLFGADQPVAQARVWKGAHSEVGLGRHQPITVAVPAGKARELTTQVERTDPLIAPIVRDQQVGTLRVQLGGQTLSTLPLQALQDDPQAGFFRRLWDSLLLLFHGSGKKST